MLTAIRRTRPTRAAAPLRLLVCAIALAVFLPTLMAQSPSKPPLVVFGNSDFAPLSYLENGEPAGIDVDVAKAIAKAMGREVRISLMAWSDAREGVLSGKADALIDLSIEEERESDWEFTTALFDHRFTLFVRQTDLSIRGVGDVAGRRVGAAPGGSAASELTRRGGITLVPFANYSEALDLLQRGEVDAIAGETSVLAHAVWRKGLGITPVGEPIITRKAAFGIKRDNKALVDEMNRAIATIQTDGTLASIADRWRSSEILIVSRGQIQGYVLRGVALGVLAALVVWISTLKRKIRERRKVESALRESQERLSVALSVGEMGAWRWTASTEETVRDASISAMLGLEPVPATGKPKEWLNYVHKDDRAGAQEQFERSVNERSTLSTEFRIVRRDGSMRWLLARGRPFFTEDGTLDYMTGTLSDITERKVAADALAVSEEKFSKAFNASPDCIAIQDIDKQEVLEVNDRFEEITGFNRKELIGGSIVQLGMITDMGQRESILQDLRTKGRIRDVEMRLRCKNGDVRTASVSAEMMMLRGRRCVIWVARDVTRQKQLEEYLKRVAEIRRLFVSELNPEALYQAITQSLSGVVNIDYAALVLFESGSTQLQVRAQTFYDGRDISGVRRAVTAGGTLASVALSNGDVTVFGGTELEALGESVAPLVAEGFRTVCCVPLGGRRGALGVLKVGSRREHAFTPDDIEILRQLSIYIGIAVENAQSYDEVAKLKNQLAQEKLYLEEEIRVEHNFHDVIGSSPALRRVLQEIQTVAPTESTVLLLGETGTGKELLARAIHELSPRKDRTFVRVDAAALPGTLLESELFGYERGAFTGAVNSKVGRFELAHRGTLFLDEAGEIPLELQAKLLRALQEREFERLGSTRTQRVDVRVIAATNRDLESMVSEGTFRSDLYYRLNVFPIRIPPLRERPEDIPMLVRHFVQRFSSRLKRQIDTIPAATMSALQQWSWPGNVRELEHVIERAVILSSGRVLQVPLADLTPSIAVPAQMVRVSSPSGTPTLADAEREAILRALREAKGVVAGETGAAARLGMKRTTLQSKMRKLGIRRPSF